MCETDIIISRSEIQERKHDQISIRNTTKIIFVSIYTEKAHNAERKSSKKGINKGWKF